ncbi:sulfotransferase [Rhodohalobacter sp.]|uniref:sulfotransferase family protein n=1 Tax=Rhodohalobacter sp. TaxID=1974210 RepID=UPI002ACDCAC5|nr:sulfotransferase [Rhodohalobacter sp.]MDZ7755178.1 sulfotransferase [Rhodohalobacter sp.]
MKKIAIFGVPRSGTTWLGQIFNSSEHVAYRHQPLFSYSFLPSLSEKSDKEEIEKFHKDLLSTDDPYVCHVKNLSGNKNPEFHKEEITHLVWKEVRYLETVENLLATSEIKVVGIVRHPCGVIKSWIKAPNEFDENWDAMEEWRYAPKKNINKHHYYGYEKWVEVARLFLKLQKNFPRRFFVISYENLCGSTQSEIKKLFKFCDLPMSEQVCKFIKDSTSIFSDDPYGVYRKNKNINKWKEELPNEIIEAILNDKRFQSIKDKF